MKNLQKFLLVLIFISIQSLSMENYLVFIGNPGVGKSTLINSLVGECVTSSGVSPNGITQTNQQVEYLGNKYIDTPGICDLKIKNQAIEEIRKAFSYNGNYKIFFILTLSSGRIRPQDIDIIYRVMDAILDQNKNFNIVINKVTNREKIEIFDIPSEFNKLKSQINKGKYQTSNFLIIENDRDIEDEIRDFVVLNQEARIFFDQSCSLFVHQQSNIKQIVTDDILELERRVKEEERLVREELERQKSMTEGISRIIFLLKESQNNVTVIGKCGGCY